MKSPMDAYILKSHSEGEKCCMILIYPDKENLICVHTVNHFSKQRQIN